MPIMNEEMILDAARRAAAIGFAIGDRVRTKKGAKFVGRIIAFDVDEMSPGCTVRAMHPEYEGTKHVYPLAQLERVP